MLGVNDRVALARVRRLAQRAIHERHMLAGVTIVDPATTVIDVDVEIGQDTVIEPFTTHPGRRRRIGRELPDQALLPAWTACSRTASASGRSPTCARGPCCARARRSGTFVEVKNSDIGPGAKVPHLSYIGDADVGEAHATSAPATITANYDGRAKHRTTIGPACAHGRRHDARGAGRRVGDGAVTAAGSVITEDVPPGALGIARERQVNMEGYTERDARPDDRSSPRPLHSRGR